MECVLEVELGLTDVHATMVSTTFLHLRRKDNGEELDLSTLSWL